MSTHRFHVDQALGGGGGRRQDSTLCCFGKRACGTANTSAAPALGSRGCGCFGDVGASAPPPACCAHVPSPSRGCCGMPGLDAALAGCRPTPPVDCLTPDVHASPSPPLSTPPPPLWYGRYDGQVFVKPPEVLTRDRLLGTYEVKPVLARLRWAPGTAARGREPRDGMRWVRWCSSVRQPPGAARDRAPACGTAAGRHAGFLWERPRCFKLHGPRRR